MGIYSYFCFVKVFHKILSVLLLLLIVTESFGISRYEHFCGDEITSESYFIQDKDCCCDEEEEAAAMSDCCKDEVKVVVHTSNDAIPIFKSTDVPKIDFVSVFKLNDLIVKSDKVVSTFFNNSSSHSFFDNSPPIRELVCCFII